MPITCAWERSIKHLEVLMEKGLGGEKDKAWAGKSGIQKQFF